MFKTLGVVLVVVFALSGCGTTLQNGVRIDKSKIEDRSKIKVYIDDSKIKETEESVVKAYRDVNMMKFGKNKIAQGVQCKVLLEPKEGVTINSLKKGGLFLVDLDTSSYRILMENIDLNIFKKEFNKFNYKNKVQFIVTDYIIENNRLIYPKNYSNYSSMYQDIACIGNALTQINKFWFDEIIKKYGFNDLVIDGTELVDNKKIVLKPITQILNLKEKYESILKEHGYKITSNKNEADEIIEIEIYNFSKTKDNNFPSKKSLFTGDIVPLTKREQEFYTSAALYSLGTNSAILMGLVIDLIDFVESSQKKDMSNLYALKVLIKKNHQGKVKIEALENVYFSSVANAEYMFRPFSQTKKNIKQDIFSNHGEWLAEFIDNGTTNDSRNLVLVK